MLGTTKGKLLASTTVLGLLAATASAFVFSAFSATTDNAGNSFSTGSITLTDNDSSTALFNVSGAAGGSTHTKCIKVTYGSSGGLTSSVKLYGATTAGTGLEQYLDVVITKGTGDAADCNDFAGATPIFNNTLANYPSTYAAGIADPNATWTTGTSATYRIAVTVQTGIAAQGKSATQTFTWEARTA